MALNATVAMRFVEMELGMSHHLMELTRENMLDIFEQRTLPTFSLYFPYESRLIIDPYTDCVPDRTCLYYLRTELEILGVTKVLINNIEAGLQNISPFWSNPFDLHMRNTYESAVLNPTTFEFVHPDMVDVFPKNTYVRSLMVVLKCIHPKGMTTVPLNMREEFLELAKLDVLCALRPIRERFASINTTFGTIEQFLQKLDDAPDKRNDLIATWRTNVLKSPRKKKIYFY
jgi:hypothetical protein